MSDSCDPIDGSPPDSPVPRILQARTLEWVAISFSNAWKWKVKVKSLSRVQLLATPWTAAPQAPPSMGFSRQEYWSDFQIYNTLLLTIVTMLYITSTEFISFITGCFYFWLPSHISLILSTTCHWQPPICSLYLSCFSVCFLLSDSACKWNYTVFVFHDWLVSLSIVPSRSICVVANGEIFVSIHQSRTLRLCPCLSYCK